MNEKFEIAHLRGRPVIMGTYETDRKHWKRFYHARHVSDEIKLAAFEHVLCLAQENGNYDVFVGAIEKEHIGGEIQSVARIIGGRFKGHVARHLTVEQRSHYVGPYYTADLEISSNSDYKESAEFKFTTTGFKTPKAKKNAQRILTNLLIDVLQLNALQLDARDISYGK
jgi:hypothetical protein